MMLTKMKKIYFPGLNGVRFIAALFVIIDHTELFKSNFGFKTLWADSYSSFLGAFGVTIFFVLSGFLITYLLLTEQKMSPINIKHFYIRRILRIWPLYYLIIIVCFFIIPHIDFLNVPNYTSDMSNYSERLLLFSGLLANVAYVYFPVVAFASILWSVAVEEQFYLIWPHIVKIKKYLLKIMIAIIILYLSVKFIVGQFENEKLYILITRTRFSSMIIGGIGAYLVFEKKKIMSLIYNRYVQITTLTTFFILLSNSVHFKFYGFIRNELISIVVCLLIINIATNKKSIVKLENRALNYFGKISYGLYVYHLFAVVIVLKLISSYFGPNSINSFLEYIVIFVPILLITTIISHLSYNYFEMLFLKKKNSFSVISSNDEPKKTDI